MTMFSRERSSDRLTAIRAVLEAAGAEFIQETGAGVRMRKAEGGRSMTKTGIDDRNWIKANPTRRYRIRRRGKPDARRVAPVTIMKIGEDGRGWFKRNIVMRDELPDSDVGAELALKEYEIITKALMDQINKRFTAVPGFTVIDNVLAILRQQTPYG